MGFDYLVIIDYQVSEVAVPLAGCCARARPG